MYKAEHDEKGVEKPLGKISIPRDMVALGTERIAWGVEPSCSRCSGPQAGHKQRVHERHLTPAQPSHPQDKPRVSIQHHTKLLQQKQEHYLHLKSSLPVAL